MVQYISPWTIAIYLLLGGIELGLLVAFSFSGIYYVAKLGVLDFETGSPPVTCYIIICLKSTHSSCFRTPHMAFSVICPIGLILFEKEGINAVFLKVMKETWVCRTGRKVIQII